MLSCAREDINTTYYIYGNNAIHTQIRIGHATVRQMRHPPKEWLETRRNIRFFVLQGCRIRLKKNATPCDTPLRQVEIEAWDVTYA